MAAGRKTGGRVKGSLNKQTVDIIEKLSAIGCDPIMGMAKIAMDVKNPLDIRSRMYSELSQYVAPKRKAVEHSAGEGGAVMGLIVLPPKAA